jgi:uncharacterized protein
VSKLPFPEKILRQHIATLGKTGAGKSSAMRDIVEHQLDAKKRVVIIDPKGDWWGLKSSADGKTAGYPVICFGNFKEERATDVPINERSGPNVAELIASGNRPCVIGFRGWMPAQLAQFWIGDPKSTSNIGFAPALFKLNDGEIYIVIDEVHNFAPKGKIADPQAGRSLHWTNRIMSEGRGLGMTFFIASQRPQKVHNDTLENCETLIAMRVTHPRSREATEEWINAKGDPKLGKDVVSTLAELKTGEAWVWSPDNDFGPQRVQFPMFSTFDSFAPPQLQKKISQSGWSEVDLDQVKQKLAAVIAEAKANDPKELKAELAKLKQELAKSRTIVPTKTAVPAEPKIVEVPVLKDEQIAQLKEAVAALGQIGVALSTAISAATTRKPVTPIRPVLPRPVRPAISSAPRRQTAQPSNGSSDLSAAQVKVLSRLVELMECTGVESVRKEQLAAWAEYSPNSGGFNNYLGSLRSSGLIEYPSGGYVTITDEGRNYAHPENVPADSGEMLERAKRVLGGSEAKLLQILHESRETVTKNDLAESAGFSPNSGGFNNYLGHMRTLGFVEYPAPGQVKCADWLYLEAA